MSVPCDPAEKLRKTCMSLGAADVGISTLEAAGLELVELFDWVKTASDFCRERSSEMERRQQNGKNLRNHH